jgi:hypothetical protein
MGFFQYNPQNSAWSSAHSSSPSPEYGLRGVQASKIQELDKNRIEDCPSGRAAIPEWRYRMRLPPDAHAPVVTVDEAIAV